MLLSKEVRMMSQSMSTSNNNNKDIKLCDRVCDTVSGLVAKVVEITDTAYVLQYKRLDPKTGKLDRRPISIERYNELVDEGRVVKIVDSFADTILLKYMDYVDVNKCSHVRVTIKEDKNFGEAIVETQNGAPCSIEYDPVREDWY